MFSHPLWIFFNVTTENKSEKFLRNRFLFKLHDRSEILTLIFKQLDNGPAPSTYLFT